MKLSDAEFIAFLRENAGIYARTVRAINAQYPEMGYTRQAVRARAENLKGDLSDIYEQNVDIAEEGLHSLMRSKNQNIQLRAIELFLRAKARGRGYGDRLDLTSGDKPLVPFNGVIPVVRATDKADGRD